MDQQSADDRIAEAFLEWVRSGPDGDLVVMLDVIQDELQRRGRRVGAEIAGTTTGTDGHGRLTPARPSHPLEPR